MSNRWTIERAMTEKPSGLHPLAGANVANFWKKYLGNRPYIPRARAQRLWAMAITLGRWPLYTSQRLFWGGRIRNQEIKNGPIFIVGHWRSGTTSNNSIADTIIRLRSGIE